jgi:intraflagellar transport protein 46
VLQDLDTVSYAKLVCALLDVPVHSDSTLIESMHLLFTLYLSFKNNPYFQTQGSSGDGSRPLSTASAHYV